MNFIVSPTVLSLIPIVIGLVQVSKIYINNRYAPLLAIVLGIVGSFLVVIDMTIGETLISGIIVGLSASGFYSGTKATLLPTSETLNN